MWNLLLAVVSAVGVVVQLPAISMMMTTMIMSASIVIIVVVVVVLISILLPVVVGIIIFAIFTADVVYVSILL